MSYEDDHLTCVDVGREARAVQRILIANVFNGEEAWVPRPPERP